MTTTYTDILDAINDELHEDSTAMINIIQDYIDTPSNGFFTTATETVYAEDGTTVVRVRTYSVEPDITIDEWKDSYWETAQADAKRALREIAIRDYKSPQYPPPDFESLVDSIFDSGGLIYEDSTANVWIEYDLLDVVHVDVASLWTSDSTSQVYFSYSRNGVNWSFLKAEADHTLDSNNKLIAASGEADAQTNYWLVDGTPGEHNQAKFPLAVRARYVRIHLLNHTRLYQLAYRYYIIPAQMVIDYLSALTADVGLLTAGVIQSTNFATGGTKLDLDNDRMEVYDSNGTLRVRLGKL